MKGQNLSMLEKQELVESYQSEIKKLQFQISLLKEAVTQLKAAIKEDKSSGVTLAGVAEAALVASTVEEAPKPTTRRGRPKKAAAPKQEKKAKKPAATGRRGRPKKTEVAASETVVAEAAPAKATPAVKKEVKKATATRKAGRPKKAVAEKKVTTPGKRGRKPNQKLGGYRLSDWDLLIVDGIKDAGKALIKTELLDLAAKKNAAENLNLDEQALNVKISQSLHKLANRRDDLFKIDFPGRGFAYALAEWKTSKGDLPKKYTR